MKTYNAYFTKKYNKSLVNYIFIYDKDYHPLFPLFNPSQFEKLKLKHNKNLLCRLKLNVIDKRIKRLKQFI